MNFLCKRKQILHSGAKIMGDQEGEKVEKYQDLAREVRQMWDARTKVMPVVMGALASVPMN